MNNGPTEARTACSKIVELGIPDGTKQDGKGKNLVMFMLSNIRDAKIEM